MRKKIWKLIFTTILLILCIFTLYRTAFGLVPWPDPIYEVKVDLSANYFDPHKNETCDITASIRKLDDWNGWPIPAGYDVVSYIWDISIVQAVEPYNTYKVWSGSGLSVNNIPYPFAAINWDGKDENGESVPEGEYFVYVWVSANYTPETYALPEVVVIKTLTVEYEEPGIEIVYYDNKIPVIDGNEIPLGVSQTFDVIDKKTQEPIDDVAWSFTSEGTQPYGIGLFKNNIAFLYGANIDASSKELQAVHIGKGKIKVTATIENEDYEDEKEINVVNPGPLGNNHHGINDLTDLDDKLISLGDQYGIPPHILKGVIDHETEHTFDTKFFQYEPNYDRRHAQCRGGFIYYSPYIDYRLSTPAEMNHMPLSQGTALKIPEDIEPRIKYTINVPFTPINEWYSVQTLIKYNTLLQPPRSSIPLNIDFTAQTVICSSYGLMQLMFPTACLDAEWAPRHGDNPYKLFNWNTNVELGTFFLVKIFSKHTQGRNRTCNYDTIQKWTKDWSNILFRYNGASEPLYGPVVLRKANNYKPALINNPSSPVSARLKSKRGGILTKSGGIILSINNVKTKMIIPPNALPEDAKVLIIKKPLPENQGISFDLVAISSQSGQIITKLNSPATIILYYNIENSGYVTNTNVVAGEASDRLAIFYNDRVDWQKIQSHADETQQTITAKIMNFGSYAIMPTAKAAGISLNNIAPNPFTPNGDGINDEIYFYYDNSDNESASIKIYTLIGSLVKELEMVNGVTPSWNGKNADGQLMEGGAYIYQMKVGSKVKSGTIILAK